ncbi:hypothetical protein ANCCAN_01343 [Ancylostoma caninum]|uniref:Uncharacterized protein n=1 Tax=Ancylostoma caninum TaxID=29170 RepID=A0A368H7U9_ANCCA|nr:hypothetical protein ANCCAN_01343 [Ancylostoma caninum]
MPLVDMRGVSDQGQVLRITNCVTMIGNSAMSSASNAMVSLRVAAHGGRKHGNSTGNTVQDLVKGVSSELS